MSWASLRVRSPFPRSAAGPLVFVFDVCLAVGLFEFSYLEFVELLGFVCLYFSSDFKTVRPFCTPVHIGHLCRQSDACVSAGVSLEVAFPLPGPCFLLSV